MSEIKEPTKTEGVFSKEAFQHLTNWFFAAVLSFLAVILFHQFLLGAISYALGYETHIHFGKVNSLPHLVEYWSDNRVNLMYAFPTLFILLIAGTLCSSMFFGKQGVNVSMYFRFWLMYFGITFGSTMLSISLFPLISVRASLYQGFAVIMHWYRASYFWPMALVVISALANFGLGFLCSSVLTYLAPSDFTLKRKKKRPQKLVLNGFVYTLMLIFPIAMALSFPIYYTFFVIMFLFSILWMPGLYFISNDAIMKRATRGEVPPTTALTNYILGGIAVAAILLTRIFLG